MIEFHTTRVYRSNEEAASRYVINQGGSRSSKTYSITQLLVMYCLEKQGQVISICRKTYNSLKGTAMRDFFEIIEGMGLYDPSLHNKTDSEYILNGNLIEFIGLDQPQKVRGRKRDIAFLNEANNIKWEDFVQIDIRTSQKIFIDFNPSEEFWVHTKLLNKEYDYDATFIKSTYKDNPFIPQQVKDSIERLSKVDENFWRVYGLGELGVPRSLIFNPPMESNGVEGKLVAYGLDFGFSSDPSALVGVYRDEGKIYVREMAYLYGCTNADLSNHFNSIGIDKRDILVADSAEPKSIEDLRRMGWNVHPAVKGQDSVRAGIDIMRQHQIYITKDSENLIKEFRNYKWIEDASGNPTTKPVDAFNHGIDAVRYVCLKYLRKNVGKYTVL